ncbi:MAG: P-II family nitrogen regulator [Rhodospirillaceae bacterium]
MNFKMIIAFVPDTTLDAVLDAARAAGATGSTVITSARGEGMKPERKFLGLDLASHRNLVFWLVEDHVASTVLRDISAAGRFEDERGAGIACQIDVEAAVGMMRHAQALKGQDEEE